MTNDARETDVTVLQEIAERWRAHRGGRPLTPEEHAAMPERWGFLGLALDVCIEDGE